MGPSQGGPTLKKCSCCKEKKEYDEFPKNRQRHDGYHVYCKNCQNLKAKQWRKKNPAKWESLNDRNFAKWRLKLGKPIEDKPRRKRAGQGYITKLGYLTFRKLGHPCADKNGRVQASHLVIYEKTGRVLKKGQTVHHKNGDTLDNSFENLEVWDYYHPPGQREEDKINWCIEYLTERGFKIVK